MTLNANIQNKISRQLKVQIALFRILISLRLSDLVIDMNDDYENSQSVNSLFKSRDIYNFKTKAHRANLESLILIQSLTR